MHLHLKGRVEERERGRGVIMGVAHYHRPWTWFVGASVFLSRTRSPTFKPGSISHLSLLHLAPAFKRPKEFKLWTLLVKNQFMQNLVIIF